VTGQKYYPIVLDGSEYFHSTQIHCPHCLHQRQTNGETQAISGKEEPLSIGSSRADEDIPLGQLWMTF